MQNYYELLQLLNIHNQHWPNLSKFQLQTIGTLKRRMDHKFVAFSTSKHRRLPLEQLKKTIWHQFQRSMNQQRCKKNSFILNLSPRTKRSSSYPKPGDIMLCLLDTQETNFASQTSNLETISNESKRGLPSQMNSKSYTPFVQQFSSPFPTPQYCLIRITHHVNGLKVHWNKDGMQFITFVATSTENTQKNAPLMNRKKQIT